MNGTLTWQLLVLSLPATAKTVRMRVWRALKAVGAAVLRDGVYLLPASATAEACLREQALAVESAKGTAHVLTFANQAADEDRRLRDQFDRSREYAKLLNQVNKARGRLESDPAGVQRQSRQLRREVDGLLGIDYFPGDATTQILAALSELERELQCRMEPGEPRAAQGRIKSLKRTDYQRRQWATRKHLWVDRAASAWLIRRFIDAKARFVWLDDPKHCPARALGFDFDGASFTHIGARVSFEVLLASFGLEADPALIRLGTLVHYLDVGGVPVAEAAGLETIMRGARAAHPDDDDALLAAVSPALDCLYSAYQQGDAVATA